MTKKIKYSRLSIEGDIQTRWICGCFETVDGFFKFCSQHKETMKQTIESQIDKLDMTTVVEE
ncbi:MAG: hypothetical protein WBV92_08090 [Nitrosotalea sp.]